MSLISEKRESLLLGIESLQRNLDQDTAEILTQFAGMAQSFTKDPIFFADIHRQLEPYRSDLEQSFSKSAFHELVADLLRHLSDEDRAPELWYELFLSFNAAQFLGRKEHLPGIADTICSLMQSNSRSWMHLSQFSKKLYASYPPEKESSLERILEQNIMLQDWEEEREMTPEKAPNTALEGIESFVLNSLVKEREEEIEIRIQTPVRGLSGNILERVFIAERRTARWYIVQTKEGKQFVSVETQRSEDDITVYHNGIAQELSLVDGRYSCPLQFGAWRSNRIPMT